MKLFYDTEFLEDGQTIELISIGMVAEDGREYYAVCSDLPWARLRQHAWLMENVVPYLPQDQSHPDWLAIKHRDTIASEIRDFILAAPDPELWADYCAYDHVALCQLFGRMIDLPAGIPMWTHDLRQMAERAGTHVLPSLPGGNRHNALHDAREVKMRHSWLTVKLFAAQAT